MITNVDFNGKIYSFRLNLYEVLNIWHLLLRNVIDFVFCMRKRYYRLVYKIVLNKCYEKNKLQNWNKRVINNNFYNMKSNINVSLL